MTGDYYRIAAGDLGRGAKIPVDKFGDSSEVYWELALEMVEGIRRNNAAGKPTVYIVPVGPVGQYPAFVRMVNSGGVSLRDCWFINMDEYLAADGACIDEKHFLSFRGFMDREVYGRIRPELVMPEAQRLFPDPASSGRIGEVIERLGGVDAVFGGVGLNGHIAFNEASELLSVEEFSALPTRVVDIAPATFYANAIGSLNGDLENMPRRAVTVGMKEILGGAKIRLGLFRNWHRAVVRRAAYGVCSPAFPVSLLQSHPDARLLVNAEAAGAPY